MSANFPLAGGPSRGGGGFGGGGFGGGGFGGRSGGPGGNGTQYTYADGRIEDDRINADELRGPSPRDDEEDSFTPAGAKVAATKRRRPILPVGIKREEYQEKGVELTTAEDIAVGETTGELAPKVVAATGDDDEAMFVEDDPKTEAKKPDDEVWTHVAPKPPTKVMIKNEHGEMVEVTAIDEIVAHKAMKEPASPELKKKDPAAKPTKPLVKKFTEEDQIKQDMDKLAEELGKNAVLGERFDEHGEPHPDSLEGHLYLFQLPPVLPPLKIKKQPKPRGADFVKPEPNDDVVMFDQPAVTSTNIDLTSDTPQRDIKDEDILDDSTANNNQEEPLYPPEGGYVGKLIVRKSGKVEMDWGGQTLEVVRGLETNFLNTAVLVDETNVIPKSGELNGNAYSMGRIAGKFVLAPKWGDEEEWDVDPDELAVDGLSWDELQGRVA